MDQEIKRGSFGLLHPLSHTHLNCCCAMTLYLGKPEKEVEDLLLMKCCDPKQVTCFKKISQLSIEECRKKLYIGKTETQQNQFVLQYMIDHAKSDKMVLYTIFGQEVCEKCWRLVYGIRHNRFYSLVKKFTNDVLLVEHGLTGRIRPSESTLRLQSWLRSFFQKMGDQMPMSKTIHLPSCLTKVDVYELAKEDLTQGGLECCSESTMYDIWKKEFGNVKIPKVIISF